MTLNRRVYLSVSFFVVLFLGFIFLNDGFFKKISLGGELSHQQDRMLGLLVDIAPPPLYIVEAHLLVHSLPAYKGNTQRTQFENRLKEIAQVEEEHRAAMQGWLEQFSSDPEIKAQLLKIQQGTDQYFQRLHELKPLTLQKLPDGERKNFIEEHLAMLDQIFQKNQSVVVELEARLKKQTSELKANIQKEISERYIIQIALLVIFFGISLVVFTRLLLKQSKMIELEKKVALESLDRVADLNQQLSAKAEILAVANEDLEAFSYSVSHDLRSPLRTISGFSQILKDDYASKLDEEAIDYLNRIVTASTRMAALIDDILKMSRVSRETLQVETFNISELVESIAQLKAEAYSPVKFRWEVEPDISIRADKKLMAIALDNLMDNAFKYSSKKETPLIRFSYLPAQKAYLIEDNGAGFDMKYKDKIFGVFQRLHSSKDFPGTGVGLSTTERVIKKHKGKIWFESTENKGTKFFFSLEA